MTTRIRIPALLAVCATLSAAGLRAQPTTAALDLRQYLTRPQNEMRIVAQRYDGDRANISRFYNVALSPERNARVVLFDTDWLATLQKLDTNKFGEADRADYADLVKTITSELAQIKERREALAEASSLVPFFDTIISLDASRRRIETMDAEKAAGIVDALSHSVNETHKAVQTAAKTGDSAKFALAQAGHAADTVNTLRTVLRNYNGFYVDYDPLYTWWMAEPYKAADKALADYTSYLHELAEAHPAAAASEHSSPAPSEMEHATTSTTSPEPALPPIKLAGKGFEVPDLVALMTMPQSQMRGVIEHFGNISGGRGGRGGGGGGGGGRNGGRGAAAASTNEAAAGMAGGAAETTSTNEAAAANLGGRGGAGGGRGGGGRGRMTKELAQEWLTGLRTIDFDKLNHDDQVDYILLRNRIEYQEMSLELPPLPAPSRRAGPAQADGSDIVGRPIGREGLLVNLHDEMIPYTPEELITIGEREFAWCESEMKKASRKMGYGDDLHKAVEKVKTMHVPAGQQPYLIRDLAWNAVDYLEKNDLITIPIVARETWGMEMMTPQRQLVNPFFTGGPMISVSYPTDTMTQEQKEESMRGNNIPFAHATAFHELIPGHELQGFMSSRYHTERRIFGTPFYGEGWACYWELYMYQRGYDTTPENRIGALFWRMHRCARIVFSLNFHMGKWTPQQCINYLVDSMGHERGNATAEVRRSFDGSYGPLYQAGYLLGALQLLDMHKELVDSGKMSNRAFHDAVVQANSMPVAMIRAIVTNQKLSPDWKPDWRFCGQTPADWKP